MVRLIYNIISVLALASLLFSCSKDKEETEAYGTLRFGDIEVTRAATDNYTVKIYAADGKSAGEWLYAEMPSTVVLPVGDYRICVASGEIADAAWEAPVYSAEKEFTIYQNRTTALGTLTCTLANVKLSVSYDPELLKVMGDDCSVTAAVGRGSLVFAKDEVRAGYFKVPAEGGAIDLKFAGTVAGAYETLSSSIENVSAGQWRKVNISIEFSVSGDGKVVMTISRWVTDPEIEIGE